MFQEIIKETLKVRPLYTHKKPNQLFPRVRYQAIAMADGFYGFAVVNREKWHDRREGRKIKSHTKLAPDTVGIPALWQSSNGAA